MRRYTVIVPVAGKGKRFSDAGFLTPKPLIKLAGKHMIQHAVECIPPELVERVILVRASQQIDLDGVRFDHMPEPEIIIESKQNGQATSVLHALHYMEAEIVDGPVLVMNCDQMINIDQKAREALYRTLTGEAVGYVPTFKMSDQSLVLKEHHKWSYVVPERMVDQRGVVETQFVLGTVEKPLVPIPDGKPIVGVFAFHSAKVLQIAIEKNYILNRRINNEIYVAPAINEFMRGSICSFEWGATEARGIGTPEDLDKAVLEQFPAWKNWRKDNK